MGIDPSSVNVADLRISRPDRSGPGGDIVGTPAVLGENLEALVVDDEREFRRVDGREVVTTARIYLDPLQDDAGDPIEVRAGDLAEWTNLLGVTLDAQEIVKVAPTSDCEGELDVLELRVGAVV